MAEPDQDDRTAAPQIPKLDVPSLVVGEDDAGQAVRSLRWRCLLAHLDRVEHIDLPNTRLPLNAQANATVLAPSMTSSTTLAAPTIVAPFVT